MKSLHHYQSACGPTVATIEGDPATPITGLACDSRLIRPGDLFVAIVGEKLDGRDFLLTAIAAGAAAVAFKGEAPEPLPPGVPVLHLTDDYAALGHMAELYHDYPARRLTLAGITGTKGKTTSAFLLRDMLAAAGHITGLIGTVSYEYPGTRIAADRTTPTPLDLQQILAAMVAAGVTHVVMEVSSHSLAQGRLGSARMQAAAFTNLGHDHGDYHPTQDDYFAAKQLLFTRHLAPDGTAVVNLDSEWGRKLALHTQKTLTFGFSEPADLRADHCRYSLLGTELELHHAGISHPCALSLAGEFNVANAMTAAGVARALGVPWPTILAVLASFPGVPGRLERIAGANGITAFIDYAHTPESVVSVLAALRPFSPGRLIVVIGCGGNRDAAKRPMMAAMAAQAADVLVLTSDNPRREDPELILDQMAAGVPPGVPFRRVTDRAAAICQVIAEAQPNDTFLIAGKGHEPYQDINGVKHPYSDLETVRNAMQAVGLLS